MTAEGILQVIAIAAPFFLAAMTFIFGALWGHHAAIGKRVTYEQCHANREECICVSEMKRLKEEMDKRHPRT